MVRIGGVEGAAAPRRVKVGGLEIKLPDFLSSLYSGAKASLLIDRLKMISNRDVVTMADGRDLLLQFQAQIKSEKLDEHTNDNVRLAAKDALKLIDGEITMINMAEAPGPGEESLGTTGMKAVAKGALEAVAERPIPEGGIGGVLPPSDTSMQRKVDEENARIAGVPVVPAPGTNPHLAPMPDTPAAGPIHSGGTELRRHFAKKIGPFSQTNVEELAKRIEDYLNTDIEVTPEQKSSSLSQLANAVESDDSLTDLGYIAMRRILTTVK